MHTQFSTTSSTGLSLNSRGEGAGVLGVQGRWGVEQVQGRFGVVFCLCLFFNQRKKIEMEKFEIKSYWLSELAMLYRPRSSQRSATRTLRNWIKKNRELSEELEKMKFDGTKTRMLTPNQVCTIVRFLGEP